MEPKQVIIDFDKFKELNRVYENYSKINEVLEDFVNSYNEDNNSMISICTTDCTTTVIGADEISKIKENYLDKLQKMASYERNKYDELYMYYKSLSNKVDDYNNLPWYKKIFKKIKL